jgi:hypothetical protein
MTIGCYTGRAKFIHRMFSNWVLWNQGIQRAAKKRQVGENGKAMFDYKYIMHVILAYLCGYVSVWIYVSVYKNQDMLQEEGGDYTPRFIVESLMCCMWRSRSRFSFKKHIKRITIHSSQLQYSNTCLPAKVWVQTAHSLAWLRLP